MRKMKRKTMQAITLILTLAMTLSLFTGVPTMGEETDGTITFTDVLTRKTLFDGSAAIEAEDIIVNPNMFGSVEIESASGGKRAIVKASNLTQPADGTSAGLGFEVVADAAASYSVWMRHVNLNGGTDSVWVSLNDSKYSYKTINAGYSADTNDYKWMNIGTLTAEAVGDVLKFRIISRETCIYDKFIITRHQTYVPTGMGDFPVQQFAAVQGSVILEAEDVIVDTNMIGTAEVASASGGKRAIVKACYSTTPEIARMPGLGFEVLTEQPGTYSVWMRHINTDGGTDSMWLSVNGSAYSYKGIDAGDSVDTHDYKWMNIASVTVANAGEKVAIRIVSRERCIFDKFIITRNETYVPTGMGEVPPEQYESFAATNGSVMIEAEDVIVNSSLVSEVAAESASGGKKVNAIAINMTQPADLALAGLGFEVSADEIGEYALWARVIVLSGGSDSIWASLNTTSYVNKLLGSDYSVDNDDYKWVKIGSVTTTTANEDFLIRLIPRELAVYDKFILTTNALFIPTGTGSLPTTSAGEPAILPSGVYPLPSVTPPAEHPRVMFRESDLEVIRDNMEAAEIAPAITKFNEYVAQTFTGILPAESYEGKGNYSQDGLAIIEAKAFDYALNGNETSGQAAIDAMFNYLETYEYPHVADNSRQTGHMLFTTAEVYDWCYPLMTDDEREEMVVLAQTHSITMEVGFPPGAQSAFDSHGGEMQFMRDWLAFAIATYDEYPDMYNYVGGRFFSEYVEPRNYWYESETHSQGNSYGTSSRHEPELWGQWLIYRMSGQTPYSADMGQLNYEWIYKRRPDGQLLREGDDYNENLKLKNTYWYTLAGPLFYASSFYEDPILKKEFFRESGFNNFDNWAWSRTPVQYIVFNDPTIGTEDKATLPLTKYFPEPSGSMVARTGWNMGMNSPDVLAYMKIGGHYSSDHAHRDAGNFQIYYKGALASESGWYELYNTDHDVNYNKTAAAHNTFLIETEDNPDGDQRTYTSAMMTGNDTAEVLAQEFGPDIQYPEYSYISGDIANTYSDDVSEAIRSMIFMPLEDEDHPAAFVVFDKITTDSATATKKFLLHMQEEPTISGNVSTITRVEDGYNGKLVNQTLLPANASITKLGGEDQRFWFKGENHYILQELNEDFEFGGYEFDTPIVNTASSIEMGWGRIEITPTASNTTDYFLNVMYVGDADSTAPVEQATLIETDSFAGAKILNRVAMFNKNKARTNSTVTFTVPGSETALKVNVAGLVAGTWQIKVGDEIIGTQIASADGGIIYFTAPAGNYELTYLNATADKTFTNSGAPEVEGIDVMYNSNYLYTEVKPTMIGGEIIVPLNELAEAMGATVTWSEDLSTATITNGETTIVITKDSLTAYVDGVATTLPAAATMVSDSFAVPAEFVAQTLGATVSWDSYGKLLKITYTAPVAS